MKNNCRKACGLCPGLTPAPSNDCFDKFTNCAELAKSDCSKVGADCRKSCGKCAGMTPAPSLQCPDKLSNCGELAATSCFTDMVKDSCQKSCGLCPGMKPAKSFTCYDKFSNCKELCSTNAADCTKSCGKCWSGSVAFLLSAKNVHTINCWGAKIC